MDGHMTCCSNTMLCIALCGKKKFQNITVQTNRLHNSAVRYCIKKFSFSQIIIQVTTSYKAILY